MLMVPNVLMIWCCWRTEMDEQWVASRCMWLGTRDLRLEE